MATLSLIVKFRPVGESLNRPIVFSTLILYIFLSGCFNTRTPDKFAIQGKIIRWARENCAQPNPCRLRIYDLTPFDWDRMYVFDSGSSAQERIKVVGAAGVEMSDLEGEIVFTQGTRIVYQEPRPQGFEEPIKNEIWFADFPAQTGSHTIYLPTAAFMVTASTLKDGPAFELKPVL
jgi:hypothetical protein